MSNDACLGYIISALRRQGWENEEIKEVTRAVYFEFDFKTVSEAEEIYAQRND
ncbi:hypothetical protein P4H71_05215 [Paenibacillus kribbensis]|uniref:hypothetical protein n=1 Tax=Paenibacillus kribbensis TaxID=172713 RepID=UPI002DB6754B|nr:hypothetical protein [Paenibacillus kribbensis]MEC0233755.1 hypothetical protein [Paenibacillus kribbensis]